MKDQINSIRRAVEMATPHYQADTERFKQALTALSELEAMAGSQEPVAWAVYWGLPPTRQNSVHFDKESAQAVANQIKSATEVRPLYAAPVAQQPQARPDFTDEWTGYLKDGETPFERFLRERKDLGALTKLYQRALEENERLKAQQPQAEPFGYVSQHTNGTWEFSPTPAGVYPDTAKSITAVYTKQPQSEKRCQYCDGTGDVHSIDGQWRGECHCQKQLQAEAVPSDVVRDAAPIPDHELVTMYDERPTSDREMIEFAREVERRHGIGVQPQHITDGSPCWCNPDVAYTDPETGASVIVHRRPQ